MFMGATSLMLRRLLPTAFCLLMATALAAAQVALPAEASQALTVFDAEFAKIRGQHEEALAALPQLYLNQLAALKRKFQESGDLDGMLSVIQESKRFAAAIAGESDPFEETPELPDDALVAAPEALRQLQDAYLKNKSDRSEARNKQVIELVGRLTGRLEALMRELTIRNQIAGAMAVKRELEQWRKAIAEGRAVDEAERRMATPDTRTPPESMPVAPAKPADPVAPRDPPPDTSREASWRSWKLDRIANYAQEGSLFAHPDLPDELTLDFESGRGLIRVQGVAKVGQAPVEMRERSWFGKALRWTIPAPENLEALFVIVSKDLASNKDAGPSVQLIVQSDKTRQQTFTLPLMYRETTLQLAYDKATGSHRIVWLQGQTGMPLDIPADAGNIRLLLTIAVCRPGERCDSTIVIR